MKHLRFIFLASFFFSLHMALLTYVNSSMLGTFASTGSISIIYAVASILSLTLVGIAPHIIERIGAVRYIATALIASAYLLYLISTHSKTAIIPFFVLYFALNSVVLYGLDLFLEHYSLESQTGNIRGLYLTIGNLGWVAAPLLSSSLQRSFGFSAIYAMASFFVVVTLLIVFFSQRGFVDRVYKKSSFSDGLRVLRTNSSLRLITILNFLLQLFFVVMVIYSPVYLTSVIGFSWKAIGIILSVMLLPFVLVPFPSGRLADQLWGEKELMALGLLLMGGATLLFAHLGHASIALYAGTLFMSRVGASLLETMCDSAFFKQVTDADSAVISIYRNMMPVSYTIGPLIAGALFMATSYYTLFSALGVGMILSTLFTFGIRDSR